MHYGGDSYVRPHADESETFTQVRRLLCRRHVKMKLDTDTATRRHGKRPAPQDVRASERMRAQRTPAPEDRALYRCGCGHAFKAEVTTSVGCPHCGTGQAW
jgi:hypothetical protein